MRGFGHEVHFPPCVQRLCDGTLTCKDASGVTVKIVVDEKTRIWLDRSGLRLPNLYGSLVDCKQGLLVEVKYRNNERKVGAVADWIKIQATE